MRESKFKAWDSKKNDWFDDSGVLYIELNGVINFGWNGEIMDDYTDRIVLLLYTGLKDKKGVEICEGDIVYYEEDTYIVRFGKFTDFDDLQTPPLRQTGFYISDIRTNETFPFYSMAYEVIGNIYENKELLED